MNLRAFAILLTTSIALAFTPGCRVVECIFKPAPKPCPPLETIVPLSTLIEEYNGNASRVPRLWARAKIELIWPIAGMDYNAWGSTDAEGETNGLLLMFKGDEVLGHHNFVLIGKEAGEEIFRTGSSIDQGVYYFWYRMGNKAELVWGRNALAGAPGVQGLPIDPLQLLDVLGITQLPSDFSSIPCVALTMNTTPGECAYVVSYVGRQPMTNRLLFRREIHFRWEEGKSRRPFKVNLFDSRGLRVMTANLSNYKSIELKNSDDDSPGPVMPTDIEISLPGEKTRVNIVLSEMRVDLERGGFPEACQLDEDLTETFTKVTQVDRNVKTGVIPR